MKTLEAKLEADSKCSLGEGPVWVNGSIFFVDILKNRLNQLQPDGSIEVAIQSDSAMGFAIPTESGDWIVGRGSSIARWTLGDKEPLGCWPVEPVDRGTRLNDGKVDPRGRLFAGTMGYSSEPEIGSFYQFDETLAATRVAERITISNGLAWNKKTSTMYYIDTPTKRIDRFAWDPATGAITDRTKVHTFGETEGFPDGMCIDTAGRLWVSMWSGARVACIDPDSGTEIASIAMPCPNVTSCCFGGEDLATLYITTASVGMSDEQRAESPHAGGLFSCRPELDGGQVSGFATTLLRGPFTNGECP